MSRTPAELWNWFEAAAVRWAELLEPPKDDPELDPSMRQAIEGLPRSIRHALDIARAVQTLVVLGDVAALGKLAKSADAALAKARKSRKLSPELRRRKDLRDAVEMQLGEPHAGVTEDEQIGKLAMDIVHAIEVRSPELNVLALPKHRPVPGRVGCPTTPAERAKATRAVRQYLLNTLPQDRDPRAIIEHTLHALGLSRERSRTVANKRRV